MITWTKRPKLLDIKFWHVDYNDPRTVDIKIKIQPVDYNEPRIVGIRIKPHKDKWSLINPREVYWRTKNMSNLTHMILIAKIQVF
jgi:hypothetical protein